MSALSAPDAQVPGSPRNNLAWNGRSWVAHGYVPRRIAMALLMRIERWDPRRDGPLNERALRQKLESRGYEVAARQYPIGATAAAQADDRERIDAVVSGLLKVTLDDESAILTAGDVVFVPRGAVRRVEVVGSSPVHALEAVYRAEPA